MLRYNWERPPTAWERFGKIIMLTAGACMVVGIAAITLPVI